MSEKRQLTIAGQPAKDDFARLETGDTATVLDALREQLTSDPHDGPAWLKVGMVYLSIQHLPEALEALGHAVEEMPDDLDARRLYASTLSDARRFDEATYQWIQAKRLAPSDARILKGLGVSFFDKKLYAKAIRHLMSARQLDADDAQVPYALGLAYEAAGDRGSAIAWLRLAVAEAPTMVEARRTLADALTAAGEMREAAGELEEALRINRNNPEIAGNLEVLQRGLGELRRQRLLGKTAADFEGSSLVREGQFKRSGFVKDGETLVAHRYRNDLAEVWLMPEGEVELAKVMLHLPDPEAAARREAPEFGVTVLAASGEPQQANYATAVTLMFLREVLGCTMTRASALYGAALQAVQAPQTGASGGASGDRQGEPVRWDDATIAFVATEYAGEVRPGLVISATE